MEIKIIFEDEDLCVIDKPSGVVVNDSNSTDGNTIQSWFKNKLELRTSNLEFIQKGGVVHRLDKDASGVLILAKNEVAYERLKSQFVNRTVEKTYLVMVHGQMKEKESLISTPIERNPNKKMRFFVGTDLSKTGITTWKVVKENADYSYLEVKIMTGRTHQIRVHMKHLGHPILSDPLYGFGKTWQEDLKICPRLFLHAWKVIIDQREFVAELPKELKETYEIIFA